MFATTCAIADTSGLPQPREISSYPFIASPERVAIIRTGVTRITIGLPSSNVASVLGEPDEIRPLYEPKYKHPKIIGYTYWYIIQRLVKNGSTNQKQESLLRVSFNLNNKVTKIDSWGL